MARDKGRIKRPSTTYRHANPPMHEKKADNRLDLNTKAPDIDEIDEVVKNKAPHDNALLDYTSHEKEVESRSERELNALVSKLGLASYMEALSSYLARKKPLLLQGDINTHYKVLQELDTIALSPMPKIASFALAFKHLSIRGILGLGVLLDIAKMCRYIEYLQGYPFPKEMYINTLLDRAHIGDALREVASLFDPISDEIKEGYSPRLDEVRTRLVLNEERLRGSLRALLSKEALAPYLVDSQLHLVDGRLALLLKGGYASALRGVIVARSNSGFFYVCPSTSEELNKKRARLEEERDAIVYEICKGLSLGLASEISNFRYIDRLFDTLDLLFARVGFAKDLQLSFILPSGGSNSFSLIDFYAPSIKDPKPISLRLDKSLLIISGVNAGGKTIVLKSILSAALFAKLLLPMRASEKSIIPHFKNIELIIEDPQSSKNDISTFAGRMQQVASILGRGELLLGIDEIELGTDAKEAALLYAAILEHMLKNRVKIIITTHNKTLVRLLSERSDVGNLAALFDEEAMMPTYSYMEGVVGKSYAFESALRYGVPRAVINRADELREQSETDLEGVINSTINLELSLRKKEAELEALKTALKDKKDSVQMRYQSDKERLEAALNEQMLAYSQARDELKDELKRTRKALATKSATNEIEASINRALNKSDARIRGLMPKKIGQEESLAIGSRVKRGNTRGIIIALEKGIARIECDNGMKLKVPTSELTPLLGGRKAVAKVHTSLIRAGNTGAIGAKLDLHGMRAEEAKEACEDYLSNALLAGYDEVLIYHGIGSGVLSRVVLEVLRGHKGVASFSDAPPNLGGFGAKLVRL